MKIYLISKLEWNEDWCDTEVITELAFQDKTEAEEYVKRQSNPMDYTISTVELR